MSLPRNRKKKIVWHSRFGGISVIEQIYTLGKKTLRPFQLSSGMKHRQYSARAQLIITDLGSDTSFNKVNRKLKLHHGIEFSESAIRKFTLLHAEQIKNRNRNNLNKSYAKAKEIVISETDGSMVGIIETAPDAIDKRKGKIAKWQELKLSMAFEPGSLTPYFSGTLGDAQAAGVHMKHCINAVGIDKNTLIHCVGDGAVWISDQLDKHFGSQAKYLVDFYHVSEYLAAAANVQSESEASLWLQKQQDLLKNNLVSEVLNNLRPYRQIKFDNKYPAERCYHYLNNRRHQLDYKHAIENKLPTGSGQIESAHRYVVQDRLKRPGAWWLKENAESMLNLRTCKENNEWDAYWKEFNAHVA